jgi:hypothetical protein
MGVWARLPKSRTEDREGQKDRQGLKRQNSYLVSVRFL